MSHYYSSVSMLVLDDDEAAWGRSSASWAGTKRFVSGGFRLFKTSDKSGGLF